MQWKRMENESNTKKNALSVFASRYKSKGHIPHFRVNLESDRSHKILK